jgi:predicted ABC-class ATPase
MTHSSDPNMLNTWRRIYMTEFLHLAIFSGLRSFPSLPPKTYWNPCSRIQVFMNKNTLQHEMFLTSASWKTRVRFPVEVKDLSILESVQTGSGAHSAFCATVTAACIPGSTAAGAWSWPLNCIWWWSQERCCYTSTPRNVFMAFYLIT